MFDRVDTTESGTLTLDELKAAFCRVDPLLPHSAVEEIMTMLDLEAVGSVSFEEVGPDCLSIWCLLPSGTAACIFAQDGVDFESRRCSVAKKAVFSSRCVVLIHA